MRLPPSRHVLGASADVEARSSLSGGAETGLRFVFAARSTDVARARFWLRGQAGVVSWPRLIRLFVGRRAVMDPWNGAVFHAAVVL